MARHSEGPKIRRKRGSTIYFARFTFNGQRHEYSTGATVARDAEKRAAQLYADVSAGRHEVRHRALADPHTPIDVLGARWLAAIEHTIDETTLPTYMVYVRHFQDFFGTLGAEEIQA